MIGIRGFNVHKCRICQRERACSFYIRGIGYICDFHLDNPLSYYTKNDQLRGKEAGKDSRTWGIELEFKEIPRGRNLRTIRKILFARLLVRGFIPTEDSTIDDWEFKSPIYRSRRSFVRSLKPIYNDYEDYFDRYLQSSHIHVGATPEEIEEIERAKEYLKDVRVYNSLWGRFPNDYCTQDYPDSRYFFINTATNGQGVEFRLPKITRYRQLLLVTLFISRFLKSPYDFEKIQREIIRKL